MKNIPSFDSYINEKSIKEAAEFQYSFSDEGLKFLDVLRAIDKDPEWSDGMTFTSEYFTEMNRTLGARQAENLVNTLLKAGLVTRSKVN